MASNAAYYRLAMKVFIEFSGTIAVPAVFAALAGKWLDERYGTFPRYVLICLGIAFIISAVILIRKATAYGKEYERIIEEETAMSKPDTDPKNLSSEM